MGAVGAGAQPFSLCKVIGTSTCDMITAPLQDVGDKLIPGICGQVDGSILPGFMGLEAGQSAFGDIYAWYKRLLEWPIKNISAGLSEEAQNKLSDQLLNALTAQAEKLKPGQSGIMAMDWHNGRRTPFANANVAGAITGLTLGSEAPAVFRALIEATAFGSRAIMDTFINEGINIKDIVAIGGIAQKSPLVMQILADVLNKPIKVSGCSQACALGAAMFGAVAGGAHADIFTAQETMGGGIEKTYTPQAGSAAAYGEVYKEYQKLGGFIDPQL
jgi:L-ribulokinase